MSIDLQRDDDIYFKTVMLRRDPGVLDSTTPRLLGSGVSNPQAGVFGNGKIDR